MLENLTIFNWVDKEKLKTIKALVQKRFLKKWETLFNEWDDAIAMYVVVEWEISLFKEGSLFWKMKWDSMFWEKAFLKWFKNRLMGAKASEDTVLIVMLYESFEYFLRKHPDYQEKMRQHFGAYNVDAKLEKN